MKSKTIAIMIFMGMLASPCLSQYRVHLGVHLGWNANFFQIQDRDLYVQDGVSWLASISGLDAAVRLDEEHTFLDLNFDYFNHFLRINYFEAQVILMPSVGTMANFGVGIRRRIPLVRNRLFIAPRAGLEVGISESGGYGASIGSNTTLGSFMYSYNLPIRPTKAIPFIYAGLNLEAQFRNGMVLSLRGSFHQGLLKIFDDEISYAFNNATPTILAFSTRGTHAPVTIGISYPLSRIWEGKIPIE